MERLRGRPLASFLPQPQPFLHAVERALERGETVIFDLGAYAGLSAGATGALSLRLHPCAIISAGDICSSSCAEPGGCDRRAADSVSHSFTERAHRQSRAHGAR